VCQNALPGLGQGWAGCSVVPSVTGLANNSVKKVSSLFYFQTHY